VQIQHRELDPARGRGKYPGGRAKVSQSEIEVQVAGTTAVGGRASAEPAALPMYLKIEGIKVLQKTRCVTAACRP
jgi:hypothetical protein